MKEWTTKARRTQSIFRAYPRTRTGEGEIRIRLTALHALCVFVVNKYE